VGNFATGGIVGGSSFFGDRITANVNSGEMILNGRQQRQL
jgi:lipopolysaccharide export system protein LptA